MHHLNLLDDLAHMKLHEAGMGPPVDGFELARALGARVVLLSDPDAPTAAHSRGTIWVREDLRPERMHGLITHELAHFLLRTEGLTNDEETARALGARLLVPTAHVMRDIQAVGASLVELRRRHRNASRELLGRRLCELVGAGLSIWRFSLLVRSYGYHGSASPTARRAAARAWISSCFVELGDGVSVPRVRAWPIGEWVYVIEAFDVG